MEMNVSIYIKNMATGYGNWVKIPQEEEVITSIIDKISCNGSNDIIIADYEPKQLRLSEHEDVIDLNESFFALEESEIDKDIALTIFESASNFEDALRIIEEEDYSLYEDCDDMGDVAREILYSQGFFSHIPEDQRNFVEMYFDFNSYGQDLEINHTFVRHGTGYLTIG